MTVLRLSFFTARYSDAGNEVRASWYDGDGLADVGWSGGRSGGGSDLRRGISGAGRRDRRRLAQEVSIEVG